MPISSPHSSPYTAGQAAARPSVPAILHETSRPGFALEFIEPILGRLHVSVVATLSPEVEIALLLGHPCNRFADAEQLRRPRLSVLYSLRSPGCA